jgi:hypothetical protein
MSTTLNKTLLKDLKFAVKFKTTDECVAAFVFEADANKYLTTPIKPHLRKSYSVVEFEAGDVEVVTIT